VLESSWLDSWQATLCDGRVILRLEETDDRQRALKRLEDWMEVRRTCEAAGTCPSKYLFVIMSIAIPGIRKFSSAEPIRPLIPLLDVPQYLQESVGIVDRAWQAASERSGWFYTGGGRAASAKISLIWSLIEPFAFSQPLHAAHNRNITQLNAETRQQLDVSGIPVIDGFRIAIDRTDCHPDNLHWCSVVQNAKVGILLTFARQMVEKINEEELLVRTREEMEQQSARAQQVAQEILRVEAVEEQRAQDAEKKRKKAAEEARARKKAEEEARRSGGTMLRRLTVQASRRRGGGRRRRSQRSLPSSRRKQPRGRASHRLRLPRRSSAVPRAQGSAREEETQQAHAATGAAVPLSRSAGANRSRGETRSLPRLSFEARQTTSNLAHSRLGFRMFLLLAAYQQNLTSSKSQQIVRINYIQSYPA